jgi:hypothetical protein
VGHPEADMGINKESDIAANLQIGPTDQGMVRIYVEADGFDLPLDFDPEEAEEIAEELRVAAEAAREMREGGSGKGKPKRR